MPLFFTNGQVQSLIIDGEESKRAFKELVHRATNLWPDAPPEIKGLADKITNADWATEALQDYDGQNTSKKPNKCNHYGAKPMNEPGKTHLLKCPDCGRTRDMADRHFSFYNS